MQSFRNSQDSRDRRNRGMEALRTLHPTYSDAELEQAYDNLLHYFDLVWRFYKRMLQDGRLERLFDTNGQEPYDTGAKVSSTH